MFPSELKNILVYTLQSMYASKKIYFPIYDIQVKRAVEWSVNYYTKVSDLLKASINYNLQNLSSVMYQNLSF